MEHGCSQCCDPLTAAGPGTTLASPAGHRRGIGSVKGGAVMCLFLLISTDCVFIRGGVGGRPVFVCCQCVSLGKGSVAFYTTASSVFTTRPLCCIKQLSINRTEKWFSDTMVSLGEWRACVCDDVEAVIGREVALLSVLILMKGTRRAPVT